MQLSVQNLLKTVNSNTKVLGIDQLTDLKNYVTNNVSLAELENDANFFSGNCVVPEYEQETSSYFIEPNKVNLICEPISAANIILGSYDPAIEYHIALSTDENDVTDLSLLIQDGSEIVEDEYVTSQLKYLSPKQFYYIKISKGSVSINPSDRMLEKHINVIQKTECIEHLYGWFAYSVQNGMIYAIDNSTNFVEVDQSGLCQYKIMLPQTTLNEFQDNKLRHFIVQFYGVMNITQVNLPFSDIDGSKVDYMLDDGMSWSDVYMIRENCQYEFIEIYDHCFKIKVSQYEVKKYFDSTTLDFLLGDFWSSSPMPFQTIKTYIKYTFRSVIQYNKIESLYHFSGMLAKILTISDLNNDVRYISPIILHGYSELPLQFANFLMYVLIGQVWNDSTKENIISIIMRSYTRQLDIENIKRFIQYCHDYIKLSIVDANQFAMLRIEMQDQSKITLPGGMIANLEMTNICYYQQYGTFNVYNDLYKSNENNVIAIKDRIVEYDDNTGNFYYNYNLSGSYTIYLRNEPQVSALAENTPILFIKYDDSISSYMPAFFDQSASNIDELVKKYKTCTIYHNTQMIIEKSLNAYTIEEILEMD